MPREVRGAILSRRHDRREGERGQALIELALVAPIIILLIAGLVQFAVIFERQIGINNAIRDAARIAATWDSKDTATATANAASTVTKVRTLLANAQTYDESKMTIEVCIGTPSVNQTDPSGLYQVDVKISVAYKHPLFMPVVSAILDGIDGNPNDGLLATNVTEFHVEHDNTTPIPGPVGPQVSSFPPGAGSCSI
ncbi:MAG TPA: TadE family protein [Candidatus Limnocylindrales bacterium]|nr:TadE family protein [Candidatus Limnocylindrales bacterium]